MQEASPASMGHQQLQSSFESNKFTETQDTELKQEKGGGEEEKKKDVYHTAVVIYIFEILPGLLRWTEMVTDALAVCPAAEADAASEVPQQPPIPATTLPTSLRIMAQNCQGSSQGSSQPRAAAASWACSSAQGPSAPSKESAPRQHVGDRLRLLGEGMRRKGPRRWKVWEGEGAAGFAPGADPSLPREGRAELVPGPAGSKEQRKSRNRQQAVESSKYHRRPFLKQQKLVKMPDFHSHVKQGMCYCSKEEQR